MQREIATFTLDTGRCPRWLFERMVTLGREITRALIAEFGQIPLKEICFSKEYGRKI